MAGRLGVGTRPLFYDQHTQPTGMMVGGSDERQVKSPDSKKTGAAIQNQQSRTPRTANRRPIWE